MSEEKETQSKSIEEEAKKIDDAKKVLLKQTIMHCRASAYDSLAVLALKYGGKVIKVKTKDETFYALSHGMDFTKKRIDSFIKLARLNTDYMNFVTGIFNERIIDKFRFNNFRGNFIDPSNWIKDRSNNYSVPVKYKAYPKVIKLYDIVSAELIYDLAKDAKRQSRILSNDNFEKISQIFIGMRFSSEMLC
ncbi:hypothetical protein [Lactobacillus hominis]|uniref:Uncharacterized protein n=1 Tax=Lactobacillus hominis DSM 23910 = CRBIP 24.179 TaxID=1423758 RepID=I7L9R2_9LACO|nr:hypothetical protein [Lactobacillus hominis]KRM85844.1 hypothetical protein FC41_GL000032 [Lactobacillus hominis DSM 23910 = CRBIP 24.179]MCT3348918.1 hypothetical protein [Lactobacillus hominis]CCI81609.1 Protein of unknown function [Lactobacillus hominis DSM 23910 = CRBIP 24.179]